MNNELWLIWKEPLSHRRFKIGILIKLNDGYEFSYVDPELGEARKVGFNFFPGFNDLSKTYKNNELFINIASRLPNKGRIDYLEILNSYNLDKESSDFDILKATRGRTLTDNYEFVPAFDLNKIEFDVAGTRHCKDINKCKDFLKINRVLYLEPEPNNKNEVDDRLFKLNFAKSSNIPGKFFVIKSVDEANIIRVNYIYNNFYSQLITIYGVVQ